MTVEIALLRGINVGGAGKLPMAELRVILTDLGAEAVETYIQSGNAVYRGKLEAEAIAKAIEAAHGFRPQVMLLSAAALAKAIRGNPFREAEDEPKTLHLHFLGGPSKADPTIFADKSNGIERWHLDGRLFYLHSPGGLSKSKLAPRVERLLGVPVTARNWATVTKLAAMAEAL